VLESLLIRGLLFLLHRWIILVNSLNKIKHNQIKNTNKIQKAEAEHKGISKSTYITL